MLELTTWMNKEIDKLRNDIDNLFSRFFKDFSMPVLSQSTNDFPGIEVSETENDLIVKIFIQGIDPDDLDISVYESNLTIKGKIKQKSSKDIEYDDHIETWHSSYFSRYLRLPCKVKNNEIKTRHSEGIMMIIIPKNKQDIDKNANIKAKFYG